MQDTTLISSAARLASIPFRLCGRRSFMPPRKALILKPCCLSQAMLTTPLLAALAETYPQARFDWALHSYARPAVASNGRVAELIDTGRLGEPDGTWSDVRAVVERLRKEAYDTVFVPSHSSILAWIAWRAEIEQRVGLSGGGRGFAHTIAVRPPIDARNAGEQYLSLARALGIESEASMEFFPRDSDRTTITNLLVEEMGWLGDRPLAILHPGGGDNPVRPNEHKRWPVERFALLANHLVRQHRATIVLAGAETDGADAKTIAGIMSGKAVNLTSRLSLGELGALCEVADLYVGNDTGPTHVAAAVGCATLAIYGPSDPARSAPFATKGRVIALGPEGGAPFKGWEETVLPAQAMEAADRLLRREAVDGATAAPSAGEELPDGAS